MDIDKIEIYENNMFFTIFPKINKVEIEEKTYDIKSETIEHLIRIIRTWDKVYIDNSYIDGNRYEVKIYQDNNVDVFKGVRNGPKNYIDFSKLIRSIYDSRR